MRRFALLAAAAALWATPAFATGTLQCSGVPDVEVSIGLGHMPVLSPISATIDVAGQRWSTAEADGTPIRIGQAYGDETRMLYDFTDENVNEIIARLRLVLSREGRDVAVGGTLQVVGLGAWAVTCIEG
ncbi:MAG TPA: hypothetical protein VMW31_02160 [Devosiaceae bacterium]|nr:hypothetical protein [Devosiaceae bacterium]